MDQFSNSSFLDRAILALSPKAGLGRIQAKTRANILMNYDAGKNGKRLRSWKAPATSADAASAIGRATMRNRSRDMVRNAPFAKRAQMVIANNVVGTGIAPSLAAPSKAAKAKAEAVILPYLASRDLDRHRVMSLSAMQKVVANSVVEAGEVLAVRRTTPLTDLRALPLTIEILEVDHLNAAVTSCGGNEVIEGIEYDDGGIAVAYHLYEKHPGSISRLRDLKSNRVPAADVLHIRRIDRPGQMRGVPWFAPVMLTLGELRDYQEAQILKQKISALLAGVVEAGDEEIPEGASGLDALSPGSFVYTKPGQKVTFTDPPQVNDYDAVMRLGLAAVAMGIGITAESLTGDLSRVNFSSMRGGRLEMDKNIESWQEEILIAQFCAGVAVWSIDAFRLVAGKQARGLSMSWTAPRRALIDPVKEIPAILKKVEGGLSSLSREQRAMGLDPDTIARERKEDAARNPAQDPSPTSETGKTK